jgi:hypothetical protein
MFNVDMKNALLTVSLLSAAAALSAASVSSVGPSYSFIGANIEGGENGYLGVNLDFNATINDIVYLSGETSIVGENDFGDISQTNVGLGLRFAVGDSTNFEVEAATGQIQYLNMVGIQFGGAGFGVRSRPADWVQFHPRLRYFAADGLMEDFGIFSLGVSFFPINEVSIDLNYNRYFDGIEDNQFGFGVSYHF